MKKSELAYIILVLLICLIESVNILLAVESCMVPTGADVWDIAALALHFVTFVLWTIVLILRFRQIRKNNN